MNPKTLAAATALTLCSTLASGCEFSNTADASHIQLAQAGAPSGRGAVTGDPAASSATPGSEPTTGSAAKSNPSGSGTSTSGGRDDNGDQGRDKMPESNMESGQKSGKR
jgi:hypothetical protein